jgi:hypothetical protein
VTLTGESADPLLQISDRLKQHVSSFLDAQITRENDVEISDPMAA